MTGIGSRAGGFGRPGCARRVAVLALRQIPVERREQQRIEQDREDRAGEDQVRALLGQQRQADAEARQDERELADLRQAGRDRQRGRTSEWRNSRTIDERGAATCRSR